MEIECVVDAKAATGESPVWDVEAQVLWWVDIPASRLHRFDPSRGRDETFDVPAPVGCVALRERGGLLVALKTGLHTFDPASGALERVAAPPFGHPDDRFNDGRCDRQGRFWVSSVRDPQDPQAKSGHFFRFDPGYGLRPMISDLITGNGLGFSPDGRVMYVSDSHASVQTIWAWDYDQADGSISNCRVFATTRDLGGRPDGAAVDEDGCYWTAANSGWQLVRFTPQGTVDRTIELPIARPTMLAFGGRELDVIYVTSMRPKPGEPQADEQPQAGGLFALSVGIRGLPEPRWTG